MTKDGKQPPDLSDPPIFEVVCGVHFETVENFDALDHGLFWSTLREEFPEKQVQTPLSSDGISFDFPGHSPRVRSWLISENEDFLVQVQDNRFYLNWQRGEAGYPRFHGDSEGKGILERFLELFSRFRSFSENECGTKPEPNVVELGKINLLEKGDAWNSLEDVSNAIPALVDFVPLLSEDRPQAAFQFVTPRTPTVTTEIKTVERSAEDGTDEASRQPGFRVEFRTTTEIEPDEELGDSLANCNEVLNTQFLEVFPQAQSIFNRSGS